MTTPIPKLFYGGRDSNANILETNVTQQDDGADITILAKSAAVAPAGASGECIFRALYMTFTWSQEVTLRITPFLDFVEQTAEAVDIALVPDTLGVRQTERFEIGLSLPYSSGAFRAAMRGAWFQVQVTTPNGLDANPAAADTDLILEQVELDHEVVRETVAAEN